jgi:hypothetical protein
LQLRTLFREQDLDFAFGRLRVFACLLRAELLGLGLLLRRLGFGDLLE